MTQHVVVVGAGPGGLANAVLLANAGYRVTVLERQPRVGGRTSSFEMDGFRFDLGPTFFHYPQMLEDVLAEAGRDLWRELDLVPLDPQYRLLFGEGGHLDVSADRTRMREEIARLSPGDADRLEPYLAANRDKLRLFEPILKSPFDSWRDLFRPEVLRALPVLAPWRSVHGDVARFFRDPRLQLAFTFQSKYLGMSPFRCPSLFSILAFLEQEHGVFHPIGGCSAISEMLARVATDLGAEIRLGEEVRGFEFEGRRVSGVVSSERRYPTDAVVVNADFARAAQRLIPDRLRRRWTDERIARKKFSCSTFMLYLGLEGRQDHLPHHTIYLAEDYRRNLDDVDRRHVLSDDPSVYVQNACVTDPALAPEGDSTLYVLVPVTHQHPNVDWRREAGPFRQRVLRQLRKLGVEDVERRIRCERVVTPDDWDRGQQIHLGATFNLAHGLDQMLHLRPHNRFEDVEGMYLVGGGTHPGSGLPTIFSSAKISADLVRQDLGTPRRAGRSRPVEPTVESRVPAAVGLLERSEP